MEKIMPYLIALVILSSVVLAAGLVESSVTLPKNGKVVVSGITERPNVYVEITNPKTGITKTLFVGENRRFSVEVDNVEEGQSLDVTVVSSLKYKEMQMKPNVLGDAGKIGFAFMAEGGQLTANSISGAFKSPMYFDDGKINQVVLFPGMGAGLDAGRAFASGLFAK